MPTRRRRNRRHDHVITQAAIDAFLAKDTSALYIALGLKPWQYNPLTISADSAPQPWEDPVRHALAARLRADLEAAAET